MMSSASKYIVIRELEELNELIVDAYIRAIRWDVVPWATVLDVDLYHIPLDRYSRGWLCFANTSDIIFEMDNICAGIGIWIQNMIDRTEAGQTPDGTPEYHFEFLAGVSLGYFGVDILATDVFLVYSAAVVEEGHNMLDVRARTELLSDELLQDAVRAINPRLFDPRTLAP